MAKKEKNRSFVHTLGTWMKTPTGILVTLLGGFVIVIAVFLILGSRASPQQTPAQPASAIIIADISNTKSNVVSHIGNGGIPATLKLIQAPPLTGATGKPEIFYEGAEFCPYCAAERWPMVIALSRFGTFNKLYMTSSSSTDIYPSTSTFTFYNSQYSSQYIDFVPLETESNVSDGLGGYTTLQTPAANERQLISTYNAPPYVPSAGGIPFIDIGGKYIQLGQQYSPQLLQGLTQQRIATDLSNPSAPETKSILGVAYELTGAICQITHQQPGNVCNDYPPPPISR